MKHFYTKYFLRILFLSLYTLPISIYSFVCLHGDLKLYPSDVRKYPQYIDQFISYAKQNIAKEDFDAAQLYHLSDSYPTEFQSIVDELEQHIQNETISIKALERIYVNLYPYSPAKQKIEEFVSKKWPITLSNINDVFNYVNLTIGKPHFTTTLYVSTFGIQNGTQTEHHCYRNLHLIIPLIKTHAHKYNDINVQTMLLSAFNKEIAEAKMGRYVFWHGRQWHWDFRADVYKHIHNLKSELQNRIGDDYVPLRFDDQEGDGFCMNYALFGNSRLRCSNTLSYVLQNADCSWNNKYKYSVQNIFKKFGIETHYLKYAFDFAELEKLHRDANSNNYGSLLLLSIEPKDLSNIYPAQAGSMGLDLKAILVDNTYTLDSKTIIDALRLNSIALYDSDYIEFAMQLTNKYALNPKSGLRIYSFNAANQAKMLEYRMLRNSLFARIEADLKTQNIIH